MKRFRLRAPRGRLAGVLVLLAAACSSNRRVAGGEDARPLLARAQSRFAEHHVKGAFVLLTPSVRSDAGSAPVDVVLADGDDPKVRMSPASTFKIANTLIGLATGTIATDFLFRWDGRPLEFKQWEQDLSLTDAFRVSCVPCYKALARRVGIERMRELVSRLAFGNAEVGESVDTFWLEGPLTISVFEEAHFVRRVFLEDLPVPPAYQRFVKEAMQIEQTSDYRLFAKTGWARAVDPNVGWYVGSIETASGARFFATRVLVPATQPDLMASVRKALTLELLRDLGVIGG